MSLYKRKDSSLWWAKLTVNGRCIQKSTGTDDRKAAQEYHDRLKAELWEQSRLGVKPAYTWRDAVTRWYNEARHASIETDRARLRWLDPYLGDKRLVDINRDLLETIGRARQAEGLTPATINRTWSLIRRILRKAAMEWEWIDRVPKFRMLAEPKRRIRWITQDEAERLLAELPDHLAAMARFSLETGLRQANVTGLQWSQVDLTRRVAWIHPDQAKARKAITVPLSDVAVLVIRRQIGKHVTNVFTYRGKPVVQVNTKAWKLALQRTGIDDFRWHDLRHTWASWHVQRGTPLQVLQELGGWESVEMVRRYAHLSGEHLAEYAASMTGALAPVATIPLRSGSSR